MIRIGWGSDSLGLCNRWITAGRIDAHIIETQQRYLCDINPNTTGEIIDI